MEVTRDIGILLALVLSFLAMDATQAQCGLQSGPMNGYSEMLEAMVWVQTKCAQTVQMRYWPDSDTSLVNLTRAVETQAEHGFTAHLLADQVTPGHTYSYEIIIDGEVVRLPYSTQFKTQSIWQFQGAPPDFRFVAGSCTFINEPAYDRPGKPYGGGYQIFQSISHENPDLMVWLGDNIYLRIPDWNSKTGIYHRYTHTRSLPEMQPLLAQTHHYATWDDHDYGPNDCDRSFWGKQLTRQAFLDFWANLNYGVGASEGITGYFKWNDCDFFLMDDRWYRAPRNGDGTYFGEIQMRWLIDALRYSTAPFKFICTGGQVLNDAAVFENFAQYPRERQMLLDSIDKYNIKGVVFITGDRHHSEISKLVTRDGDVLYDITASALTSSCSPHPDEPNHNRVSGSMIGQRNYAVFSVRGPEDARTCHVTFKDSDGNVLFDYVLK